METMLSPQQIFDYVVGFIRRQGQASKTNTGLCRYRGPDGRRCAAGCLIPDELYNYELEDNLLDTELMHMYIPYLSEDYLQLVRDLQRAHDLAACYKNEFFMGKFNDAAAQLAEEYGFSLDKDNPIKLGGDGIFRGLFKTAIKTVFPTK